MPIRFAIEADRHRIDPPHRERLWSVELCGAAGVEPCVAQFGGEALRSVHQDVAIFFLNEVLRHGRCGGDDAVR